MRGQPKEVKSIELTGNVFLEQEELINPKKGDLLLYAVSESKIFDYHQRGHRGYLKLKIYDSREWCFADTEELLENREHHFSKTELPIDCFYFCREILSQKIGTKLYRTYRCHYSTYLHQNDNYKGKKGHLKK